MTNVKALSKIKGHITQKSQYNFCLCACVGAAVGFFFSCFFFVTLVCAHCSAVFYLTGEMHKNFKVGLKQLPSNNSLYLYPNSHVHTIVVGRVFQRGNYFSAHTEKGLHISLCFVSCTVSSLRDEGRKSSIFSPRKLG